jgi:hypothetical protein
VTVELAPTDGFFIDSVFNSSLDLLDLREAVKSEAAASVASLLTLPVVDRTSWTLPRRQAETARQAEVSK